MRVQSESYVRADMINSSIRSQIHLLGQLIQHIEQGNPVNGYVFETLRTVEREIRDLRKIFFNQ